MAINYFFVVVQLYFIATPLGFIIASEKFLITFTSFEFCHKRWKLCPIFFKYFMLEILLRFGLIPLFWPVTSSKYKSFFWIVCGRLICGMDCCLFVEIFQFLLRNFKYEWVQDFHEQVMVIYCCCCFFHIKVILTSHGLWYWQRV